VTSPFDLVAEISGLLDELAIPYVLGGSVASSLIGEPRTTVDVDVAVRLRLDDLDRLAARVADSYYFPAQAARSRSATRRFVQPAAHHRSAEGRPVRSG